MHEIITLQFGQKANFLATHFWNTQESYQTEDAAIDEVDHDISFRRGIGINGVETYLPRTVVYDLKGGFGSLKQINELYEMDDARDEATWNGPQVMQTAPPIQSSPYTKSLSSGPLVRPTKETVFFFSDFASTHFHPRSLIQINEYSLGSSLYPFEHFESGVSLFESLETEHDLLDRDVRLWAEECDQLQGFQMLTSSDDAWAGFTSSYVERIRDEYPKTSLWTWGLEDGDREARKAQKLLNAAKALYQIASTSSLYIPLSSLILSTSSLPQLDGSLWHTSALQSTLFETATLPTRRLGSKMETLDRLEATVNTNGNQRIAGAQVSIGESSNLIEESLGNSVYSDSRTRRSGTESEGRRTSSALSDHLDIDLFPSNLDAVTTRSTTSKKIHHFGRLECIRSSKIPQPEARMAQDTRMRSGLSMPTISRAFSSLLYPLPPTFPDIFSVNPVQKAATAVHSAISTTTQISQRLQSMRRIVNRLADIEEREYLSNGLGELVEAYTEGWDSGSDEDDD